MGRNIPFGVEGWVENTVCFLKQTLMRSSAGAISTGWKHTLCQSPILGLGIGRLGVIGMVFGVQDGEGK